ncbi:MAG: flippase [Gemmatimonadales bacterium]
MTTSNSAAEPAGRLVARNTLYNVLGQALPVLVGIAAIPVTVRSLGEARFGLLGLAWAILGSVGVLDLGLGRATTKFVAEYLAAGDDARLRRVATLAVASQAAMGVVGGVLFALLGPLLTNVLGVPPGLRAEARGMLFALALSVPFVVLSASLRAILEAAQRFDLANLIRTPTSAAVLLVPAVAAALGARLPLIVLLLVLVRIVACVAAAIAIPRAIRGFRWTLDARWETLRPLLGFGGWVAVSNVVSPLLVYLERFLLASLAGVAAVAYYTAPYEVVTRLLIVPAGLAGALLPALSARGHVPAGDAHAFHERLFARPLRFLLLALAPLVILLIVSGGPLIGVWLGPDYGAQSTTAFAILAVGVLINGLAFLPYTYLLGRGRPDLPAKFHLLELPLYVLVGWLLIRQLGVNGAAWAWTLRVTADAALLCVAVWRVEGVKPEKFLGEGGRGWRAVAAVAALAAAAVASAALVPGAAARIAIGVVAAATFAVAVWRYVLDDAERAGLRRVLT